MYNILIVLGIIIGLFVLIEIILLVDYIYQVIKKNKQKQERIKESEHVSDVIYKAKNKSSKDAFEQVEPIIRFWENMNENEFPCKVGNNINEYIKSSKDLMRKNGIRRTMRFFDVSVNQNSKSEIYRKWDQGGKEWRVFNMTASLLEKYYDKEDNLACQPIYHSDVEIICLMSRRLMADDKKKAVTRDKWGRKTEIETFYSDIHLENCPSCGAKLLEDQKDITCPYCGSTIISDYFDWQVEVLEIEPVKYKFMDIIVVIRDLIKGSSINSKVTGLEKTVENKVVRFNENDFRNDVKDGILSCENNLLDFNIGTINIKSVEQDNNNTLINIEVPVYKEYIDKDKKIKSKFEKKNLSFSRTRYTNKFDKNTAVILKEKQCPCCGRAFEADDDGNCKFCGTRLNVDNSKWILV